MAMLKARKKKGWFTKPWTFKSWWLFSITAFEYSLYLYFGMWVLHWIKLI